MRCTPAHICISSAFTCAHVQTKMCLLIHCSCSTWQAWIRGHWSNPWNWTSWIWKNLRGNNYNLSKQHTHACSSLPCSGFWPLDSGHRKQAGSVFSCGHPHERRSRHIKAWLATLTSLLLVMPRFEVRARCCSLARVSGERLGSVLWHTITGWQEDQSLAKMFNEDRWGTGELDRGEVGCLLLRLLTGRDNRPLPYPTTLLAEFWWSTPTTFAGRVKTTFEMMISTQLVLTSHHSSTLFVWLTAPSAKPTTLTPQPSEFLVQQLANGKTSSRCNNESTHSSYALLLESIMIN